MSWLAEKKTCLTYYFMLDMLRQLNTLRANYLEFGLLYNKVHNLSLARNTVRNIVPEYYYSLILPDFFLIKNV